MRNSPLAEMTLPELRWPGISWCTKYQKLLQGQAGDEEKHFIKNTIGAEGCSRSHLSLDCASQAQMGVRAIYLGRFQGSESGLECAQGRACIVLKETLKKSHRVPGLVIDCRPSNCKKRPRQAGLVCVLTGCF